MRSIFIIILIGLFGCEEVVNININKSADNLVVEGWITDQQGPQILKIRAGVYWIYQVSKTAV